AASPRESLTSNGRGSAARSAAVTELDLPRASPTTSDRAAGLAADGARLATTPATAPASHDRAPETALLADLGRLLGQRLVQWSGEASAACDAGLRNAALVVVRFAGRPPKPLGAGPRGTTAAS